MWWRRLIKWLSIAVLVVVLLALIIVWPVLGVNPFEGDVENLWLLTSNKVDFFIRIPPVTVLDDEPLIRNLERSESYGDITLFRAELLRATRDLAREVNPQIPMGLFQVDLKRDFLGGEMAIAGTIQRDFSRPRFDNFILLTRVPFYARFISALKRGFVRNRIQDTRIELVNGLYFKLLLGPQVANALRPYRTPTARGPGGDQTFYMVRIKDVVLFSDNAIWIEDAIAGGRDVLKADAWFDSEFIHAYEGGNRVEVFVRPQLTHRLMIQHARKGTGGILGLVRELLPVQAMGELTLRIGAKGASRLRVDLTNLLAPDGFDKLPAHLQVLYDSEKGDPRYDLGENGIARFVPRKNTVGAAVVHIRPEHLVDIVVNMLTVDQRSLLDDEVRRISRLRGRNYSTFRKLLLELTADLADTHLLIAHRPKIFRGRRYERPEDDSDPPLPPVGLTYTLVSAVKDSARPDRVRENVFQHLQYIGMKAFGTHKSGKFHLADLITRTGDEALVMPAYGALGSKRFFVFSTAVEGAEAVFEAAENPDERLIRREGLGALLSQLPPSASMSLIFDSEMIKAALFDRVRISVENEMDIVQRMKQIRLEVEAKNEVRKRKGEEPLDVDEEVAAWQAGYIYDQYPILRGEYVRSLGYLDPLDTIVGFAAFGVGSEKKVQIGVTAGFATGPE